MKPRDLVAATFIFVFILAMFASTMADLMLFEWQGWCVYFQFSTFMAVVFGFLMMVVGLGYDKDG